MPSHIYQVVCATVEWWDLFGSYKLDQVLYYEGGLTTPGCSEVVHWNIWPKVQYASKDQIKYLAGEIDLTGAERDYYPTVYHETYRNVQPIHKR